MSDLSKRTLAAERRANVGQRAAAAAEAARASQVNAVPAPDPPVLCRDANGAHGLMFTDAGWDYANALHEAGATADEAAGKFGCKTTGHFFGLVLRYESERNWV